MNAARRRYLIEQQLVSVVLNGLISGLFVWLMFGHLDRIGLWGAKGLALDLVPTTFMITLMMTIALTLITRRTVASGRLQRLGATGLPRNPLLRGLVLAVALTLALVPVTTALLWLLWEGDWSYPAVMVFKIVYGVALGLIVTPIVVSAAIADRPRSGATAR